MVSNEYSSGAQLNGQRALDYLGIDTNAPTHFANQTPFESTRAQLNGLLSRRFILTDLDELCTSSAHFSQAYEKITKTQDVTTNSALILSLSFNEAINNYLDNIALEEFEKEYFGHETNKHLNLPEQSLATLKISTASNELQLYEDIVDRKRKVREDPFLILDDDFVTKLQQDVLSIKNKSSEIEEKLIPILDECPQLKEYSFLFTINHEKIYVVSSEKKTQIYAKFSSEDKKHAHHHNHVLGWSFDLSNMDKISRSIRMSKIINSLVDQDVLKYDPESGSSHLKEMEDNLIRRYGFSILNENETEARKYIELNLSRIGRLSTLSKIMKEISPETSTYKELRGVVKGERSLENCPMYLALYFVNTTSDNPVHKELLSDLGGSGHNESEFLMAEYSSSDNFGKMAIIAKELKDRSLEELTFLLSDDNESSDLIKQTNGVIQKWH